MVRVKLQHVLHQFDVISWYFAPHHEDVVDCFQYDQNDFSIFDLQQVDDCLQGSTLHQVDYLLHSAPTGEVCHCPHSLPLSLEVSLRRRKEKKKANVQMLLNIWKLKINLKSQYKNTISKLKSGYLSWLMKSWPYIFTGVWGFLNFTHNTSTFREFSFMI